MNTCTTSVKVAIDNKQELLAENKTENSFIFMYNEVNNAIKYYQTENTKINKSAIVAISSIGLNNLKKCTLLNLENKMNVLNSKGLDGVEKEKEMLIIYNFYLIQNKKILSEQEKVNSFTARYNCYDTASTNFFFKHKANNLKIMNSSKKNEGELVIPHNFIVNSITNDNHQNSKNENIIGKTHVKKFKLYIYF